MKKIFIPVGIIAAAIALLFVPVVQSYAASALSIFRIQDTKTINITVSDIDQVAAYAKAHQPDAQNAADKKTDEKQSNEKPDIQPTQLNNINDFKAFKVNLPKALQDEKPVIEMVDTQSKNITINASKINAELKAAGVQNSLDSKYDGQQLTISTPPAVNVRYPNVDLAATMMPYLSGPEDLKQSIWKIAQEFPAIPEDIRAQLANINIDQHDAYIPVVEGVCREVDLGGTTGYLYSTSDLTTLSKSFADLMPSAAPEKTSTDEKNTTALIWTKDGIIYTLAGSMSDSALANIARSIY